MSEIKIMLKNILENRLIPQAEEHLDNYHKLMKSEKILDEDIETIRELEFLLVQFENILLAINQNKINESESRDVYERLLLLNHEE